MAYLINDQTGEAVEIPEGESIVGRGPLLKVNYINFTGMMATSGKFIFSAAWCTVVGLIFHSPIL
jgi:uncharacterized membrane protein